MGAILDKDKDVRFLSNDIVSRAVERSNSYLRLEKDTRGYVEGKGWAHSIAHGADLLVSAINHPKYNTEQSKEFLDTVHNCLFKGAVYIDDEDERLICVIESLIDKDLEEKELEKWILNVFNQLETVLEKGSYSLNFFRVKTNIMNFVKTLYFRLGYKNIGYNARKYIKENLKIWHEK
jgi:isoleucyl-tRNA synthetase